jgi:hypothetical protein
MRYKDQLRDAMKWAKIEAGYDESLPDEEKYEKMTLVQDLYDEAKREIEEIEEEEEYNYKRYETKYRRNWDAA